MPKLAFGVADAVPVERVVDDRDLVEADEQLVDERRLEHAVPVHGQVAEGCILQAAEEQRDRALVDPRLVLGKREPSEDLVVRRRAPVNPRVPLVRADRVQALAHEVAADAGDAAVRQRVQRCVVEDRARERTDPTVRNLIPGERRSRYGILNRRGNARQIAVPPALRRHRNGLGPRRVVPGALIVPEEEHPVPQQRPAERPPEDVLLAIRFRRMRPVVGPRVRVHAAVAVELERIAAKQIRSGLDDVADDRPRHVPGVGGIVVGLDADLGERVRTWLIRDEIVDRLVHVDAVNRVIVGLFAIAVDIRTSTAAGIADARERTRIRRDRAGQQQGQLTGIAAVERKCAQRGAGNDLPDCRRLRLEHRRIALDFDRLLETAKFQFEVEPHHLLGFHLNRLGRRRLEPGELRLDDVGADRKRGHRVAARLVRDRGVGHIRGLIGRGDGCARHGRAALIADDARERGGAGLSKEGGRSRCEEKQKQKRQSDAECAHGVSCASPPRRTCNHPCLGGDRKSPHGENRSA
jgi:hypothetical protein